MKALGDLNRFRIMLMLMERPLCVCELLEVLDIAGGTLSNHLKILREAELIDQRKDGRWIEYFIGSEAPRPLLDHLREGMEESHPGRAGRPGLGQNYILIAHRIGPVELLPEPGKNRMNLSFGG